VTSTPRHSEAAFETVIEQHLLGHRYVAAHRYTCATLVLSSGLQSRRPSRLRPIATQSSENGLEGPFEAKPAGPAHRSILRSQGLISAALQPRRIRLTGQILLFEADGLTEAQELSRQGVPADPD
jgi:hypothetical protein